MRILFIGSIRFSLSCLTAVIKSGGNVIAVLGQSAAVNRSNADYADLEPLARRNGIPYYAIEKIGVADTVRLVESLRPDIIFVFGFSQIIPKEILRIPPKGCVGSHPARLPCHRGRHPLIWTLVYGLDKGTLTFFYLDEGVDSGDILWQREFEITVHDNATTLYEKIETLTAAAISEFLPQLASGDAPRTAQDHAKAGYWPKRTEKDGEIDWQAKSGQIHNLIRALAKPYVGAHTYLGADRMIVWKSEPPTSAYTGIPAKGRPGDVVLVDSGRLLVRTGDGMINIKEWELPMDKNVTAGMRLGRCPS